MLRGILSVGDFISVGVPGSVFGKRILIGHRKPQSPASPSTKMQTTINLALHNACTHLKLPAAFADAVISQLWRAASPPPSPPAAINLEKLNRQQVQKLEELATEAGETMDEKTLHKMFLNRINGIPSEGFKSKSLIDHMKDFLGLSESVGSNAAAAPAPVDDDDEDVVDVSFHLREYSVGIKSHRVYEMRGGIHVYVGQLGMNEFKGMVMPEIED